MAPTSAWSMAKAIRNRTMPPATRKDPRLVPIQPSRASPLSAATISTPHTVSTAMSATRRRMAWE